MKRIFLIFAITVLGLTAVIFCNFEKIFKINNLSDISSAYKDFMHEKSKVLLEGKLYSLNELVDLENGYYAFCDVDKDKVDELNLKSYGNYYVIKWVDSSLKVIYWGHTYEFPVNEGILSGIAYYRLGGAPLNEVYKFSEIDPMGEVRLVIEYEWCDMNGNDVMDQGDYYDINGNEVNMENWLDNTEQYRNLCIDKNIWKVIGD